MPRDLEHTIARLTVVTLVVLVLLIAASTPIAEAPGGTAKKNGCHTNIDTINSQIELYYANTGNWPADLAIVTGNTAYFPDGAPTCPVSGGAYPATLVNNRVDTTGHNH